MLENLILLLIFLILIIFGLSVCAAAAHLFFHYLAGVRVKELNWFYRRFDFRMCPLCTLYFYPDGSGEKVDALCGEVVLPVFVCRKCSPYVRDSLERGRRHD
jgi:hypothetical protein